MANKYSTIQQHEPLRLPEGWTGDRRRLIAQLEEIFDDIYRRFGRLSLEDLSPALRKQLSEVTEVDGALTEKILELEAIAGQLKLLVGEKPVSEQIDEGIEAIETFENTAVEITPKGFHVKSTGTFTVESQKFDVDENGEMSAVNCRLSGDLSVDGNAVWHAGNLILSTVQPSNLEAGLIWVKPDMTAIPAAGTWTKAALTSRPDQWLRTYDLTLTGTSIGAAPSNAKYTYEVRVPVYHKDDTPETVTVYLGASSGAETINMGTQTFTDKGTFKAKVESTVWLGNSAQIYMRVKVSNPNLMTINSHSPFTCTLTAKSTSATGWKACEVQMYTG